MNKTKRLLALLLTVVMAFSMLSSFAFAATGADANTDTQTVADVNPLDDNVLIIDANAPLGEGVDYTLVWNNEQFDGLKTMEKVFRTINDFSIFLETSEIEDLIVLVINMPEGMFKVERDMTLYSPAYKTVPYIRGTAVDGSDWAANPEFTKNAITITGNITIDKDVAGDLNFYGFIFNGNFIDTTRLAANRLNIKVENCTFDLKGAAGNPIFSLTNAYNKVVTSDASLVIKNTYFAGAELAKGKLLGATQLPAFITFDGVYVEPGYTAAFSGNTLNVRQDQTNSEFVIRNSNIAALNFASFTFNGDTKVITDAKTKGITIENNIMSVASDAKQVFAIHSTRYTSLKIKDNYIAADAAAPVALIANTYSNSTLKNFDTDIPLELEVTGNVLNGIDADIRIGVSTAAKYKNELRDVIFNIDGNYLATDYAADLTGVDGEKLSASAHGVSSRVYYKDYLKTILLNEDIFLNSAEASNGFFILDEASRKAFYIMDSGDATAINFELGSDEAQVKWYADKECTTPIEATDIAYDGEGLSFFFRVEKADGDDILSSDVYTVQVTRETAFFPFFLSEFNDEIIRRDAVLCDVGSAYIADGRLYAAEWNGETYTFIKGVNVFDSIDAATTYFRTNKVENPQFMLKDLNGSKESSVAWNVTFPADYFTENYSNCPVIKGTAIDGSDWAYNKGTGEGQFDPDKTIRVLDIAMPANGTGGTYNFYGFTITRSVCDWSRMNYEPKMHLVNCVFDISNWGSAALLRADEFKYPSDEQRKMENELIIKDSYFTTNGTTGRITSGTLPATIRLDGVFFDGPLGTLSSTDYLQQVTTKSVFAIENSLFKNYYKTGIFYNEGMWNVRASNSTDKRYIINNNTFVNSVLSSGGFVDQAFDYFNRAEFIGNKVYNEKAFSLFYYRSGGNVSGVDFTLIIKDNIVNAGLGSITLAPRKYTEETAVTHNYVTKIFQSGSGVTYGGVELKAEVDGKAIDPDAAYFIDSEMKCQNNIIHPYSVVGKNVVYNKSTKTATVTVDPANSTIFSEMDLDGLYLYTVNIANIIENKLGNQITYTCMGQTEKLANELVAYNTERVSLPIEVDVSISSPDNSKTPQSLKIIITDTGAGINTVTVDGQDLEYVDGGYAIELSATENGELVEVVGAVEGTQIALKDGNTAIDTMTVDVAPGETKEYTLEATYDGLTYKVPLTVKRRLAEYAELDEAIAAAKAVDMSKWLPKFARNLKNAIKAYEEFDKETATQADVDALTQLINDTLSNYIERVEIDELVEYAKTFRNRNNKYCLNVFAELKDAIAITGDIIPSIETQQQYDDAIAYLQGAIDALREHEFGEYVSDNNATYSEDGTKSAECKHCDYVDSVVEEGTMLPRIGWVYENGVWSFYDAEQKKVTSVWMKDSTGWVYIDENGNMATNKWVMDSQGWCYVGADGYCVTNKWVKDSTGWCYLGADGRMVTNEWVMDSVGWCYVGADGYCVTDCWMKDSKGWVYLNEYGNMATNKWVKDSQGWCYVGEDGYCVTNAYVEDSYGKCWLDENGRWNGVYA